MRLSPFHSSTFFKNCWCLKAFSDEDYSCCCWCWPSLLMEIWTNGNKCMKKIHRNSLNSISDDLVWWKFSTPPLNLMFFVYVKGLFMGSFSYIFLFTLFRTVFGKISPIILNGTKVLIHVAQLNLELFLRQFWREITPYFNELFL